MSNLMSFPDLQSAREQAAVWVARLDRGLSEAEQAEFRHWQTQPGNDRALRELRTLWSGLDQFAALSDLFPIAPTQPAAPRPRRWRLVAAGLSALALGTVLMLARHPSHTSGPIAGSSVAAKVEAYATAVGEHRTVALADGSVLMLNTDTLVEAELAQAVRTVRLVRGQAHFTVAHDASRPFRVYAGARVVQAVGTAFEVWLHPDQATEMVVTVTEGQVSVAEAGAGRLPLQRVSRGELLQVDANGRKALRTLGAQELESRLAWRQGMLVFDGETLQDALDTFSRYTTDRFVIRDRRLRDLRIGGYFPTGDTRALGAALHSGFGLRLSRQPDGVLLIERETLPAQAGSPN